VYLALDTAWAADRRDATIEGIVPGGLKTHRTRLGHAIAVRDFGKIHLADHPLHDFDRARHLLQRNDECMAAGRSTRRFLERPSNGFVLERHGAAALDETNGHIGLPRS
jgi:hypothetical protein